MLIYADSERERDEWNRAIARLSLTSIFTNNCPCSAINKHSSMLLNDKEDDEDGSDEER